jgi:hypothetical protein
MEAKITNRVWDIRGLLTAQLFRRIFGWFRSQRKPIYAVDPVMLDDYH